MARCPSTGDLGIAVQSHYFAVGNAVPFASPAGALAVQSVVAPNQGKKALSLLESGASASEALNALVAEDPGSALRQIAIVDRFGRIAQFTGDRCVPFAGEFAGDGFAVQGNMLDSPRVLDAMRSAYSNSTGLFPDRLLGALEAAEQAGGDIRGRRSAALRVIPEARRAEEEIDLRVDDDDDPLRALRCLLDGAEAAMLLARATSTGPSQSALEDLERAVQLAPDSREYHFWLGVCHSVVASEASARRHLDVATSDRSWARLLARLIEAGLVPATPLLERYSALA